MLDKCIFAVSSTSIVDKGLMDGLFAGLWNIRRKPRSSTNTHHDLIFTVKDKSYPIESKYCTETQLHLKSTTALNDSSQPFLQTCSCVWSNTAELKFLSSLQAQNTKGLGCQYLIQSSVLHCIPMGNKATCILINNVIPWSQSLDLWHSFCFFFFFFVNTLKIPAKMLGAFFCTHATGFDALCRKVTRVFWSTMRAQREMCILVIFTTVRAPRKLQPEMI